ncbi:U32 family peptidase [Lacrimispora sp. NSJ-141]|uniref:U32 family peptidase n=1 Tax=Lientehia hominis TaxID=2897778 RepID=A0AAP2RGU4_9FIRM|nr:U32 family peptidase [Lientehia hominis]MCD2491149.1 U32 family peptidase [Lientehia hominis]
MRKKVMEVLAPAGSFESMQAAVSAGADAVYMGGTRFGARAYAENPEQDMLLEAINFVHLHGKKLYLTVNTLLKEKELRGELYDFLRPLYEAGIDALIVQDMGVWQAVKRWFPGLPIHASTQMTITGVKGAMEAERLGASRIVTARELSVEEIREIREQTDIEIETFVHGALCYCYSGQCLYSSLIGGRSGNRGRCAQPCRLPYGVWEKGRRLSGVDQGYVMNLKDLCGLDFLPALMRAGVDSLKIEGRMKSSRYTAGVVSVYRKYVDMLFNRSEREYRVSQEDRKLLLGLFDRGGFSDGYFRDHNGKQMVALSEKPAFREVEAGLLADLDRRYLNHEIKEKIKGNLTIAQDLPAKLSLIQGETSVSVEGDTVLSAKNRPLKETDLRKQMEKLGGTPFVLEELSIQMDAGIFLPVKALNELRRKAADALKDTILKKYRRKAEAETIKTGDADIEPQVRMASTETSVPLSVYVEEEGQFYAAVREKAVCRIYFSVNRISWVKISAYAGECHDRGKEFYLALPQIYRSRADEEFSAQERFWHIRDVDGFLIRVVDELHFMEKLGTEYDYVADHSLYSFNKEARNWLRQSGMSMDTAPLELNERDLRERGCAGSEMIVYGRLPMMVSAQCIRNTAGGCDRKPDLMELEDRKKKRFPVKNYCRFCYNMIYNSDVLWLADEIPAIMRLKPSMMRLLFTTEEPGEVTLVLKAFGKALRGEEPGYQPAARTKGHFRRGAE